MINLDSKTIINDSSKIKQNNSMQIISNSLNETLKKNENLAENEMIKPSTKITAKETNLISIF